MNAISIRQPVKTMAVAKQEGQPSEAGRFLRIEDVIATTGLSRATIYRLVDRSDFPAKIALTARCVGWWEAEVIEWLESRRSGTPRRPDS